MFKTTPKQISFLSFNLLLRLPLMIQSFRLPNRATFERFDPVLEKNHSKSTFMDFKLFPQTRSYWQLLYILRPPCLCYGINVTQQLQQGFVKINHNILGAMVRLFKYFFSVLALAPKDKVMSVDKVNMIESRMQRAASRGRGMILADSVISHATPRHVMSRHVTSGH